MSEGPSVFRKVQNLAVAVFNHAVDGLATVSTEEYQKRLAICRGCEFFRPKAMTCQHEDCGCYLVVKAHWASESCPLAKWLGEAPPTTGTPPCGCG